MQKLRYTPTSKRATDKRHRAARQLHVIERAVGGVRLAMTGSGLCLPMCVLLMRLLAHVLPERPHFVHLGALRVAPAEDPSKFILFDPRGPTGIDGGFHAWLEDSQGRLLDPSIHPTLDAYGCPVDRDDCFTDRSRQFVAGGLSFLYAELPELELIGLEASEPHLEQLLAFALEGKRPPPGRIYLDVAWRSGPG